MPSRFRLPSSALHHVGALVLRIGLGLGGQDDLVALALQRFADRILGKAAAIAFGRIEVVDAPLERVPHQRRVDELAEPKEMSDTFSPVSAERT